MIPRDGLTIWLIFALSVAVLCCAIAIIDGRKWTIEWIGSDATDIVVRHILAIAILPLVLFNYVFCYSSCNPWLIPTTLVLYLMAVVGWPVSALLFSIVYLLGNTLWGGILGANRGLLANLFQFIFFLLGVAFAFLHLRERVLYIALLPIPSIFIELSDRYKRAWKAMRLPAQVTAPPSQEQTARSTVAAQGAPQHQSTRRLPQKRVVQSASSAASNLYMLTFLLETGGALLRSAIYFFIALIVLSPVYIFMFINSIESYGYEVTPMFGSSTWTYDYGRWFTDNLVRSLSISLVIGLLLGCWPLIRSLFHTIYPYTRSGAGQDERDALGAREPTRAEHQKIIDTLQAIMSSTTVEIVPPSYWLVIDLIAPDAYTIGSTVYVTRAAIEDRHFAGIMAHELGHLAHRDGDLILALRRFVIPLAYYIGVDRQPTPAGAVWSNGTGQAIDIIRNEDEKIFYRFKALQIKFGLAFWFGGIGLFLLGQKWARFWRARDFLADDFAVMTGQADSLMNILKSNQNSDAAQPFLLSNRPYTAERLDRLQG